MGGNTTGIHDLLASVKTEDVGLASQVAQASAVIALYEHAVEMAEALVRILWVKDCGIDGKDDAGVCRNFPDEERDVMYKIARECLDRIVKEWQP